MIKSLIYKEWLKTRWIFVIIFIAAILLHWYVFSKIGRALGVAGREHIWDVIVNRDQFMFSDYAYSPLFSAVLIAIFQFVPETVQKRLKLTLHLPLRENTIILWIVGYGAISLVLIYIIQLSFFTLSVAQSFPPEILKSALVTIAPWYLSGIAAYFAVAAICIEPSWKKRIVLILIAIGIVKLFYISSFPGSFYFFLPVLPFIALIYILFTGLSVYRFKAGVQD